MLNNRHATDIFVTWISTFGSIFASMNRHKCWIFIQVTVWRYTLCSCILPTANSYVVYSAVLFINHGNVVFKPVVAYKILHFTKLQFIGSNYPQLNTYSVHKKIESSLGNDWFISQLKRTAYEWSKLWTITDLEDPRKTQ